jgi:Family of unknown function (DUF6279)
MKRLIHKTLATAFIITGLLIISGCSITRLGYDHGPRLTWWWLDGYIGFDQEQKTPAKQAIRDWFDWHRTTQLLEYASWLSSVRRQIEGPLTPAQVCHWSDELQDIISPALDHAVQLATPVAMILSEPQWRHLEQRYTKSNDKLRHKYLQPDPDDRLNASIKRTTKRFKQLYGRLDNTQHSLIAANAESSPFDPEEWLFERQRRQQLTLVTLQRLSSGPVPTEQAVNQLRKLAEHTFRSDDPGYRLYQEILAMHICGTIAQVHNSATPTQRQHAYDKLLSWENDLQVLAGDQHRTDDQMHTVAEQ